MELDDIRSKQETFFKQLFEKHQGSPYAVASESNVHKKLRYSRLCKVFEGEKNISVHDVGMGMGHLYQYIHEHNGNQHIDYSGTEIVPEYYDYCIRSYPGTQFYLRDILGVNHLEEYDYVLLSGVFHQMRDTSRARWEEYMFALLMKAFQMARRGIAFNVVSEHVDFYQKDIYYCNLGKLTNFIVDRLSRFYVIDHTYPIFEATLFVHKENYIRSLHPEPELKKYFKDVNNDAKRE